MQTPLPARQLDASPYYLPNLVAAMVASVGVVVGSVGPWATVAELLTKNGAWLHGTITLVLGAVAGITSFIVLNRARAGVSPRSLLVLAWVAPIAGLICLVIAVIDIHQVATAGESGPNRLGPMDGHDLLGGAVYHGSSCRDAGRQAQ